MSDSIFQYNMVTIKVSFTGVVATSPKPGTQLDTILHVNNQLCYTSDGSRLF